MYDKNSHDLVWPWPKETHPSLWFLWLTISLIIGYNTINMIFPDIYFRHWQFCTFDRTVTSLHWQAKKYPRLAKKMLHVIFNKACLLAKFGCPYYLWGLRTHKWWFSSFFHLAMLIYLCWWLWVMWSWRIHQKRSCQATKLCTL